MGTPGTERKVTITYYGFAGDEEIKGAEFKAGNNSLAVIVAEILMSKSLRDVTITVETTPGKMMEDYAISAEDEKTIQRVFDSIMDMVQPQASPSDVLSALLGLQTL
jgi:hypothetical protein